MKKLLIILHLFSFLSLHAQNTTFSKLFKLKYPDFGVIYDVANDSNNNSYFTYQITNLQIDSSLINLIKINKKGDTLWAKVYGIEKKRYRYIPRSILIDKNNDLLVVGFVFEPDSIYGINGKGFVLKVDKNGNQQWLKKYSDNSYDCRFRDIISCSDGNYLLTDSRRTYNYKTKQENLSDPYIVKIDTSGSIIWQKVIDNYFGYSEIIQGVVETKNQEYLMVGYRYNGNTGFDNFILKLDKNGKQLLYDWYGEETYNDALTGIIPNR